MTKRNIAILLTPNIFFAIIGICALFLSHKIKRYADIEHLAEHREKYNTFVTNVMSGKWHLTTENWLRGYNLAEKSAESNRVADAETGEVIHDFAYYAGAAIILQVAAVYIVTKRVRQP